MRGVRLFLLSALLAIAAGCSPPEPEPPRDARAATTTAAPATAKVFAGMTEGRQTESGETFNHDELVAAHPSYSLGGWVWVTNLDNGRSVTVRIVDRVPEDSPATIELSRRAAGEIGLEENSLGRVNIEPLQPAG